MKQSLLFWTISLLITTGTLIYQRITGPTYPISGMFKLNGREMHFELKRTHAGESNHVVKIETDDAKITGYVEWKRYKTTDEWNRVLMVNDSGILTAELPHQPPAGKLIYQVTLVKENEKVILSPNRQVVIRFRGEVPTAILFIHILAMFIGLLFSTRAGMECLVDKPKLRFLIVGTVVFTGIGGLIMGPIMQWYSFGALWTGFPFGIDLTDNKTALALLFWIITLVNMKRTKNLNRWVFISALITLIVYLIPHSMLGSELDYSKVNN